MATKKKDNDGMAAMRVRLMLFEEILGTASNDKEIHAEFIASKAPDAQSREEEVEAIGVEAVIEKGKTVFPKAKDGRMFIYDYQLKGFFKNAQKAYNALGKGEGNPTYLPSYKTAIDNLVFVKQRRTFFQLPDGEDVGDCQRPLRAQTAQGERVALANSESLPAGTVIEFTVETMKEPLLKNARKWLDYGERNGIGQWHNSGKGRFIWQELDADGSVIGGNDTPEKRAELAADEVEYFAEA